MDIAVQNRSREAKQSYRPMNITLSAHAVVRSEQRSFNSREIAYVLAHGRLLRRTGIRFYFLGERDVPFDDQRIDWVQRLVGTTLLVDADGNEVITLYKNPAALCDIRKKAKYRR
jgi:hypothetical protein